MQRTKNRPTIPCDASEEPQEEDRVAIKYNGRYFSIPRSHYERQLTPEDFKQSDEFTRMRSLGASGKTGKTVSYADKRDAHVKESGKHCSQTASSKPPLPKDPRQWRTDLDDSLKFLEDIEGTFRQSMWQPSPSSEQKITLKTVTENKVSHMEPIFTLDDMVESKETVIEQPITTQPSNLSVSDEKNKSSTTLGTPSAESLEARKSMEVTEKLFQLKSKVVNLIDQTINQIESKQDFTGEGPSKTIPLHPGGDGSKLDYRATNLQILKTDSFTRNRKDIRTKLYREIKTVLKRLEDLETLE